MDAFSVSQILALYTWFPLISVLFIYLLIARFYQRVSQSRTYFWLFILPMVLFGVTSVRYASVEHLNGDIVGDTAQLVGSLVLLGLSTRLFRLMMSRE